MKAKATLKDNIGEYTLFYETSTNYFCPKCGNRHNWKEISPEIRPPIFTSFICSRCSFPFEIELNPKNQAYFEDIVKQLEAHEAHEEHEDKSLIINVMDGMDV